MTFIGALSRLDLAALIAETLHNNDIDVVLSGGSCVSIYSSEKYVSQDLDFIDISIQSNKKIAVALSSIGFLQTNKNSRYFAHPDTHLTVEFPSAPLTVGDEHINESDLATIETETGTLRLLSPTDCVKDRLANYYYFKDKQCFEQAVLVAKAHPINFLSLKQWHKQEDQVKAYDEFMARLSQK